MKNNKGLSYYELLIVVTIMGLMVLFATISLGTINRNNVNRTADNLENSAKQARNNALSKGNKYGYLNLYYKDKKLYVNVGEEILSYDSNNQEWKEIGNGIDYLGYKFDGGGNGCYSGTLLNYQFKQSTGECLGVKLPFSSPTDRFKGDQELHLSKSSSDATVLIGQYGSIEVKIK